MAVFSRWVAKAQPPVGNALVPASLGRVLGGTSSMESVLIFKLIAGLCPGSDMVFFTWAGR